MPNLNVGRQAPGPSRFSFRQAWQPAEIGRATTNGGPRAIAAAADAGVADSSALVAA